MVLRAAVIALALSCAAMLAEPGICASGAALNDATVAVKVDLSSSPARKLAREGFAFSTRKPRRHVVVSGVRVEKSLYNRIVRLAKVRAEREYRGYLSMLSRTKIVPDWKERVRVRLATRRAARDLVANFFGEYRRILQPHHSDLDYASAQDVIRGVVRRMGREQFSLFVRWFKNKYHTSLHEGDYYEPAPRKDPFNAEPGHSGEQPIEQLTKEDRGVPLFSNDPNFLDPRRATLSEPELDKISRKGGFPKDWAGRLVDFKRIDQAGNPAEQGDPNDASLAGNA